MKTLENSISRNHTSQIVEVQECDDPAMKKTLSERLIECRQERGWKKSELQRRAGLKSSSTLTELEKGTLLNSPQLPAIAAALGVEVLWLQSERGMKYRTGTPQFSDLATEAATIIDRMPEHIQRRLLHYLRVEQEMYESVPSEKTPPPR